MTEDKRKLWCVLGPDGNSWKAISEHATREEAEAAALRADGRSELVKKLSPFDGQDWYFIANRMEEKYPGFGVEFEPSELRRALECHPWMHPIFAKRLIWANSAERDALDASIAMALDDVVRRLGWLCRTRAPDPLYYSLRRLRPDAIKVSAL